MQVCVMVIVLLCLCDHPANVKFKSKSVPRGAECQMSAFLARKTATVHAEAHDGIHALAHDRDLHVDGPRSGIADAAPNADSAQADPSHISIR